MGKEIAQHYILPGNFFQVLSIQNYIHHGLVRTFHKGESIVFPDENVEKIIFTLSGRASVSFINEDSRQKLMYYVDPYTFADRIFPVEECYVHIVAEEESRVCLFEKEQFLTLLQHDRILLEEVVSCYASKCSHFMQKTKEIVLYKSSARVLRLLCELTNAHGRATDSGYEVDIKLSQRAISEITGVHFVTINKLFRYLKDEGILSKTSSKIIINDLKRLNDLIEEWSD